MNGFSFRGLLPVIFLNLYIDLLFLSRNILLLQSTGFYDLQSVRQLL